MEIFSQLDSQMQIFLVGFFALIFGSFTSLVTYRINSKEPIVFGRSKCVNCGVALKFFNLIPLFSWLFQKGKCSNCHSRISVRYPAIELTFLGCFLLIYFVLGQQLNVKMLIHFAIASVLISMVIVDLEHYFIPDIAQYFFAILATIFLMNKGGSEAVFFNLKAAFIYIGFGLALWVLFYYAAGVEAIGVDDLKFFFIAGLLLGTNNFLSFMMISGLSGIVFGNLWQKVKKDDTFPFAPSLCFATFICLLFGSKINLPEIFGSFLA